MPERAWTVFGVVAFVAASSCSLFVSLDGLSDVGASADASPIGADGNAEAGDASADAGADMAVFFDDFNRPDDASIGNGWIEKNPNAWLLKSGQVVREDNDGLNFQDNISYRPSSEDVLNVQSSVQFVVTGTTGFPQVWTRVQKGAVIQANQIGGYGLSMSGSGNLAAVFRCDPVNCPVQLTQFNVTPALDSSSTYRLRLITTGTDPVQIQGFIERQVGTDWSVIGTVTLTDSTADRITTAGSVGFSAAAGDPNGIYSYDDFTRTAL